MTATTTMTKTILLATQYQVFRTFLGGGMFEHLIGPLSPRMVPVRDPDYHHQKSKSLAEVSLLFFLQHGFQELGPHHLQKHSGKQACVTR